MPGRLEPLPRQTVILMIYSDVAAALQRWRECREQIPEPQSRCCSARW